MSSTGYTTVIPQNVNNDPCMQQQHYKVDQLRRKWGGSPAMGGTGSAGNGALLSGGVEGGSDGVLGRTGGPPGRSGTPESTNPNHYHMLERLDSCLSWKHCGAGSLPAVRAENS